MKLFITTQRDSTTC